MKPIIVKGSDQVLTLKHYKMPLREIPKSQGYGYYGALSVTMDGEKLQCHVCGKLFASVSAHARQAHKMTLDQYREKYQIAKTSALVSEIERQRLKDRTLEWLKSLSKKEKEALKSKAIANSRDRRPEQPLLTLETKNKRGTCPDQLLAKIVEVAEKLGRTPSLAEFITETGGQRFKHLIFKTFGSWKKAIEMVKLEPKEHGRGGYKHYSNEQLLEYLTIYAEENRKIPTATDSKRGLIPDYQAYRRRFGTFENARRLAGVYQFIS